MLDPISQIWEIKLKACIYILFSLSTKAIDLKTYWHTWHTLILITTLSGKYISCPAWFSFPQLYKQGYHKLLKGNYLLSFWIQRNCGYYFKPKSLVNKWETFLIHLLNFSIKINGMWIHLNWWVIGLKSNNTFRVILRMKGEGINIF